MPTPSDVQPQLPQVNGVQGDVWRCPATAQTCFGSTNATPVDVISVRASHRRASGFTDRFSQSSEWPLTCLISVSTHVNIGSCPPFVRTPEGPGPVVTDGHGQRPHQRLDLPIPHARSASTSGTADVARTNLRHINEIRRGDENFSLPTGYMCVLNGWEEISVLVEDGLTIDDLRSGRYR